MPGLRRWSSMLWIPVAAAAVPFVMGSITESFWDFDETNWKQETLHRREYAALRARDVFAAAAPRVSAAASIQVFTGDTTETTRDAASAIAAAVPTTLRLAGIETVQVPIGVVVESRPPRDSRLPNGAGNSVQLPTRPGEPCLVRVSTAGWPTGGRPGADLDSVRRKWVTSAIDASPCLFFARYGPPAPAFAASLDSIDWMLARRAHWWGPDAVPLDTTPPRLPPWSEVFLGASEREYQDAAHLVPCLEQAPTGCGLALQRAVLQPRAAMDWDWVVFPRRVAPGLFDMSWWRVTYTRPVRAPAIAEDGRLRLRSNGRNAEGVLADVARHLGPERFARVWTMDRPWTEAYAAVAGESFDAFAARWLDVEPNATRFIRGAALAPSDWRWLVGFVAAALLLAVRASVRREIA